jgi:class 3 adenylate cyclase
VLAARLATLARDGQVLASTLVNSAWIWWLRRLAANR